MKRFKLHYEMRKAFSKPLEKATDAQLHYALKMCNELRGGPLNGYMGNHKQFFEEAIQYEIKRRAVAKKWLRSLGLKNIKFPLFGKATTAKGGLS